MGVISHDVVHVCAVFIELSLGALFIHRIGAAEILKKYSDLMAARQNGRAAEILEAKSSEVLNDPKIKQELADLLVPPSQTAIEVGVKRAERWAYAFVVLAVLSLTFEIPYIDKDWHGILKLALSLGSFLMTILFYKKCNDAEKQSQAIAAPIPNTSSQPVNNSQMRAVNRNGEKKSPKTAAP